VSRVRKLFWLVFGGVSTALLALVLSRLVRGGEQPTPKSLGRAATTALSGLIDAVEGFATDVRQGMTEHEATLREAAALDGGRLGRPESG
jgi:hypothetical protein